MNEEIEYKQDWDDFVHCLERRRITEFYHYTVINNIYSILKYLNILSRYKMSQMGIMPARINFWGSKLDSLKDYICLTINPLYSIQKIVKQEVVVLGINPRVIYYKDTVFSPVNSARSSISIDEIFAHFDLEGFESLFVGEYEKRTRFHEAEVLVKNNIGIRDIQTIYFPTSNLLNKYKIKYLKWKIYALLKGNIYMPKLSIAPSGLKLFS